MSATLLMAGALLAQSALPAVMVTGRANSADRERADVAYAELSQGRNDEAIARITQSRDLAADDPAAMINLGAAYARTGREADARRCYARALASRERYDLELANGQWMDSRAAARKATALLRDQQTLALASHR